MPSLLSLFFLYIITHFIITINIKTLINHIILGGVFFFLVSINALFFFAIIIQLNNNNQIKKK